MPLIQDVSMIRAEHPPTEPRGPTGVAEDGGGNAAPHAPTVRGVLGLCLASFAVMLPWPLLAILATHSYFDNRNEAILLFGGITGIPLAILTLVGLSETAMLSLIVLAWIAAAIVPDIWLARRLASRRAIFTLLGVQAAFSLAQAAMGALMIFGKAV